MAAQCVCMCDRAATVYTVTLLFANPLTVYKASLIRHMVSGDSVLDLSIKCSVSIPGHVMLYFPTANVVT